MIILTATATTTTTETARPSNVKNQKEAQFFLFFCWVLFLYFSFLRQRASRLKLLRLRGGGLRSEGRENRALRKRQEKGNLLPNLGGYMVLFPKLQFRKIHLKLRSKRK